VDWAEIIGLNEVDEAFESFWDIFKTLYDLHFPLTTVKFNRNIHKRNHFMTHGLLTSRNQKNVLFLESRANPSEENKNRYINYRNVYNKLLRAAKKLYFHQKVADNAGNPRGMWDTLNEALDRKPNSEPVSKLVKNDAQITDKKQIIDAGDLHVYY
jgi:hypothetical protein